jgi:hypothetical protein
MEQADNGRQFNRETDGMYIAIIFLDDFDFAEAKQGNGLFPVDDP